jgi:hypothetical protein
MDDFAAWSRPLSPAEVAQLASNASPQSIGNLYFSIESHVDSSMHGANASGYLRIPFTIDGDPADLAQLLLDVKYEDGFVASINGQTVASRNAPGSPAWNSASTTELSAPTAETLDLSVFLGALRGGQNVLAIQLLNASAADDDLYFDVERLYGVEIDPTNLRYFDSSTPG